MKHLCEIFATIDGVTTTAVKYEFNFQRANKFRVGWHEDMSSYEELYENTV